MRNQRLPEKVRRAGFVRTGTAGPLPAIGRHDWDFFPDMQPVPLDVEARGIAAAQTVLARMEAEATIAATVTAALCEVGTETLAPELIPQEQPQLAVVG